MASLIAIFYRFSLRREPYSILNEKNRKLQFNFGRYRSRWGCHDGGCHDGGCHEGGCHDGRCHGGDVTMGGATMGMPRWGCHDVPSRIAHFS